MNPSPERPSLIELEQMPACEACDAGFRLAGDGVHYDDAKGGWTWGVCRREVARLRLIGHLESALHRAEQAEADKAAVEAMLAHLGLEPWVDGRSIHDGHRPWHQHVTMILGSLQARAEQRSGDSAGRGVESGADESAS